MRACSLAAALAVTLIVTTPAGAVTHVFSYDSADPQTESMTESGLTFVFDKGLLGVRLEKIIETHDIGEADLKPADEHSVLGSAGLSPAIGAEAPERQLYEITDQADGKALKRALCHSARAWLAVGRLKSGLPLRVHAVALDPATHQARLCMTLNYAYHGEWLLQPPPMAQPDRTDRFNDTPNNLPY